MKILAIGILMLATVGCATQGKGLKNRAVANHAEANAYPLACGLFQGEDTAFGGYRACSGEKTHAIIVFTLSNEGAVVRNFLEEIGRCKKVDNARSRLNYYRSIGVCKEQN